MIKINNYCILRFVEAKGVLMKNKVKRSTALLCLGFVLCSSVVTGCSLVTTNYQKYYDAVAARIEYSDGHKIEITRRDVRTTYATYGFDQYLQNGLSQKEAYTKAVDYLVSKELAIRDAEIKSRAINPDDAILTQKEKDYLWEKTYESMESNIDSYLNKQDDSQQKPSESSITRNVYERQVKLEYNELKGEYSLILPESAKSEFEEHEFWSSGNKNAETEEGKAEIYELMLKYIKDNKPLQDAYQKYFSDIKTSEKELKLSKDEKSVFEREIERVYGIVYDSYMINKYNDFISGDKTNNVLISEMLDLYSSKVRADYATYNGVDQTDTIKEKSGDLYYIQENNTNWFYVSHILVKFDETEQADFDKYTAEIEKIKNGEETEYTLEYYENKIEEIYTNLTGVKRVETSENIFEEKEGVVAPNVSSLYNEIKSQINTEKTEKDKIEKFDDLIYIYNEDPGMFNATYNYIVGVDYTKPTIDEDGKLKTGYTVYSNWVEEFNKAAVELYNNGNGQVGDLYTGGEYNGLIRSNYGVHIMMYAGEAKNLFNGINSKFELNTKDIITLYNARLNAGTEKTYFDVIYEECVPETSYIFQNIDLKRLKDETSKITYYPKAF